LQLEASDAENGVDFAFHQDQRWVVPANTTIEVPFDAVPRQRPWVGPPRTYDVQVTARRPGNVAEVRSVHSQLVYAPRFASLGLLRRVAFLAGLVVALLVVLSALPSELRCQLVRENGSLPILGRGCGATAPGAPAAVPTSVGVPTSVAVGGAGAAAAPTPAAGQQAVEAGVAQAIGGAGRGGSRDDGRGRPDASVAGSHRGGGVYGRCGRDPGRGCDGGRNAQTGRSANGLADPGPQARRGAGGLGSPHGALDGNDDGGARPVSARHLLDGSAAVSVTGANSRSAGQTERRSTCPSAPIGQ